MQNVAPKLSETPGGIRGPAPEMGAHNEEIYRSLLGKSDAQMASLHEITGFTFEDLRGRLDKLLRVEPYAPSRAAITSATVKNDPNTTILSVGLARSTAAAKADAEQQQVVERIGLSLKRDTKQFVSQVEPRFWLRIIRGERHHGANRFGLLCCSFEVAFSKLFNSKKSGDIRICNFKFSGQNSLFKVLSRA